MATLEQQLAEAEAKVARLKEKAKKQDTAEKVVIGGYDVGLCQKKPKQCQKTAWTHANRVKRTGFKTSAKGG